MNANPFEPFGDKPIKDSKLETKYKKRVIDIAFNKTDDDKPHLSKSIPDNKLIILPTIIGLCLLILIGRLAFLQIAQGEEYREIAEGNRIRIQTIKAPRGIIYDKNNEVLVKNIPNFQVVITPMDFPDDEATANSIIKKINSITDKPFEEINASIEKLKENPLESQVLIDNITWEQAVVLDIESINLPGINLNIDSKREYLTEPSFSHILGYIGKINREEYEANKSNDYLLDANIGKSGVELYYEEILKGINGKKRIEVDSRGREKEIIASSDAVNGSDIILSIDKKLQDKTTEILKNVVNESNAPAGTAIVMNPQNGEIMALVNWPSYNNNDFTDGIEQEKYTALLEDPGKPLFNHAISGEYPPGSTFKPMVAAAALEEGVINENTTVQSTGGIEINQWWFPDWKEGGHGTTDVRKALADSVNTFFYLAGGGEFNKNENKIYGGLGVDRIKEYAIAFGFDNATGIDLPGEKDGFLPTRDWKEKIKGEMWYIGDTYHLAIGQGDVLVTPLQIAAYTSVFANGGIYYKPHLVKEIHDNENGEITKISGEIVNDDIASDYNIGIVRQGMKDAVNYGSAKQLQSLPVSSAGKTGTAQIGGTDKTHSWFTVFAPYENPEIVVTVLVEEGGDGTEAALPAAQEILEYYFNNN
ncbi:MAG: penicillin-binding protein 2 [Patescibacteria group bacterium]